MGEHVHPNMTFEGYMHMRLVREQREAALDPRIWSTRMAQASAAVKRMSWVGVTEFYGQSICALRSMLAGTAMCSCEEKELRSEVKETHGTHPDELVLTGPMRAQIMREGSCALLSCVRDARVCAGRQ